MLAPEGGILREGDRLERTIIEPVHHRGGAVYVHAAQHDEAPRDTAERPHHIARVRARARDHVDHDVRREAAQLGGVAAEPVPVAADLPHLPRQLGAPRAAVEDPDIVPTLL